MPDADLKSAAERFTGAGADAPAPAASADTPKPRKKRGGARPGAGRPRKNPKPPEPEEPTDIQVSEPEIQEAAYLGSTVWDLVAVPFGKLKALNEDQKNRLGNALAPLIKKYMPLLGGWQYEVGAALILVSLVRETLPAREAKTEDENPDVLDMGAPA